jgi:hypothetical protein
MGEREVGAHFLTSKETHATHDDKNLVEKISKMTSSSGSAMGFMEFCDTYQPAPPSTAQLPQNPVYSFLSHKSDFYNEIISEESRQLLSSVVAGLVTLTEKGICQDFLSKICVMSPFRTVNGGIVGS